MALEKNPLLFRIYIIRLSCTHFLFSLPGIMYPLNRGPAGWFVGNEKKELKDADGERRALVRLM
jgi:hypothetical protein